MATRTASQRTEQPSIIAYMVARPKASPIDDYVRVSRLRIGSSELAMVSFPKTSRQSLPDTLSDAEKEVVLGALEGFSNHEIAARRRTSMRTVANQLASIYRKLGVNSRSELALQLTNKRPTTAPLTTAIPSTDAPTHSSSFGSTLGNGPSSKP